MQAFFAEKSLLQIAEEDLSDKEPVGLLLRVWYCIRIISGYFFGPDESGGTYGDDLSRFHKEILAAGCGRALQHGGLPVLDRAARQLGGHFQIPGSGSQPQLSCDEPAAHDLRAHGRDPAAHDPVLPLYPRQKRWPYIVSLVCSGGFDGIIAPELTTANTLLKSWLIHAKSTVCGAVIGAQVPIAFTSRFATAEETFLSLAFCAILHDYYKRKGEL